MNNEQNEHLELKKNGALSQRAIIQNKKYY